MFSWEKVQKILNSKSWSLHHFSIIADVPDATLRMYKFKETVPSYSNACKIADALGISLDDLRGDENGRINKH